MGPPFGALAFHWQITQGLSILQRNGLPSIEPGSQLQFPNDHADRFRAHTPAQKYITNVKTQHEPQGNQPSIHTMYYTQTYPTQATPNEEIPINIPLPKK